MHETFEEILTSMGGIMIGSKPGLESEYGLHAPGRIIHEVGTTRMGNDPSTSVLNQYTQAHVCKNLVVVVADSYVSLSIMILSWTILVSFWSTYVDILL